MSDTGEEDSLDQLPNEPSIKLFERDVDLETFVRAFKKVPVIWNVGHPKHMNKSVRNAGYMRLAQVLRMRRGKGVVRRAVRAVRAFRLRLHETLLEACAGETRCGEEGVARARERLPHWAREADKYLHLLRDLLEQQDNASGPRTTRRSSDKPSIPKAFSSSRADGTPGMLWLSQRVVCGMRHAARRTGALDHGAAAAVGAQLGDSADHIYELWCNIKRRALKRVQALILRGDVLPHSSQARPTALDWAAADLALIYGENIISDEHYQCYTSLRAMLLTFSLVQRRGLESPPGESPPAPAAWRRAAQAYSLGRTVMSPVLLQRRWHLMKVDTRRRLSVAWQERHCGRVLALHRAIATAYPHVATAPMLEWAVLLREGNVALPTNERGPAPGEPGWFDPVDSDDDDLILVENEIETIDLEENTNKKSNLANIDEHLDVVGNDLTRERTKSRDMPELDESDVDVENLDLPKIVDEDSTDVDGFGHNSNDRNIRASVSEQNISDNNDDSNVSQSEQNQKNKGNKHADKTIHFDKEIVDADETSLDNNVLEVLNSLDAGRVEMSIMFSSDEEDIKGTFDTDLTVNDKDLTKDNIEALESGKNVVKSKSITVAHKAIVNSNDTVGDKSTPKTKEVPADTHGSKIPNKIVFEDDQAINTNDNSGDETVKPETEMCDSNNKRTESLTKNVNINESQTDITNSKDLNSRRSSSSDSDGNLVIDLGRLSENIVHYKINESLESLAVQNDAIRKAIEREMLPDDKDSSNNEHFTVVNSPMLLQLLESTSEPRDNPIGKDNFTSRNVKDYAEDLFQEAILNEHRNEEDLATDLSKTSDLDMKEKLMEYAKNIVNDLLEDGLDEEEMQDSAEDIDPKLLMCPVVVLIRLNITEIHENRPQSPTADPLQSTPHLSSLYSISEKFDQTLSKEFYQKKSNLRLLMMCRPCSVVLQRVKLEVRGVRVAKKVELPDIEEVRRNNRRILTAQVAPISVEQGIGSQRVSPDSGSETVTGGAINAQGAPRMWLDESGARGEKRPSVEPCRSGEGVRVKCARREKSPKINDMAGVPTHEDLTRLLNDLAVRSVTCGKHDAALGELGVRPTLGESASCARCAALALASPRRAVTCNAPDRESQSADHQSTSRSTKGPHRIKRHRERNRLMDPEEAAREWQRQKNIGAEKFGLKPRSFQKRKVVEAPSEPATLTLVKDPEEAPRVLNKDLKPNEKIVTMNKHGQVVLNNNKNAGSTDQIPSSHWVIEKDGTILSPIAAQQKRDALRRLISNPYPSLTPIAELKKADSVGKVQTTKNTENATHLPLTKENLVKHAQKQRALKLAPSLFKLNAVAAINKTLRLTKFTPRENQPDVSTESSNPPKETLPIIIGVQSLAQNENQIKMSDKINTSVRDSVIQSPERLKVNLWGAKTPHSPQRIISLDNKGNSPSGESCKARVTTDNQYQNKPQTRFIVPANSLQHFAQSQSTSTVSNVTKTLTHGGTTITNSKEANNSRRLHVVVSQGSVSQMSSPSAWKLQNQRFSLVSAAQTSQASTASSGCFKIIAANPQGNTLQLNSVQSGPPRIASRTVEVTFARKIVPLPSSVPCGVSESTDKVKTFPMHKQDSLLKVPQASGKPLESAPNSRNFHNAGESLQSTLLSASEDITSLLSENRTLVANFAETKTVQTGISENTYEVTLENIEQTLLFDSANSDRISENIKSSTGSKDNLKNDTNINQQGTAETEENLERSTYRDVQSTTETVNSTDFQASTAYSFPTHGQLKQTARKKTTNALHALSLISTFHSTASYRPPKFDSSKSVARDTDTGISDATKDNPGETENSQSVSNCGPGETEVELNKTEDSKTVSTVTDIGVISDALEDRPNEKEDSFSPDTSEALLFEDDTEAEAHEEKRLNEGTFQDSMDQDEISQFNSDEDDTSPALIIDLEPNEETSEAVQIQVGTDTAKICEQKSLAEENTNQPVSEQDSTLQKDMTQTDTTQIISIEDDVQVTSVQDKTHIRSVKVDAIQGKTENSTLDTSSKAEKLLTSDAQLEASQVILIDDDSSSSSVQSTSLSELDQNSTSEVGANEQKTSTDIMSVPASEDTLQEKYLTSLPESPIDSEGVMSIVISQVKSLQEPVPRTIPSETIASSSQNQVETSFTTSIQSETSQSSRIPAQINSFKNSTSRVSSVQDSVQTKESRATVIQTVPPTVSSRTLEVNSVQAGSPHISLLHDNSPQVETLQIDPTQAMPQQVNLMQSGTLLVNSVQAGPPQANLLQGGTLLLNSVQTGQPHTYSIVAGKPLVSAMEAGQPQASSMQPGTLLVNSVQAGPSQVYSTQTGLYNATQVSYPMQVNAIQTGQPQANFMQAGTLLVNSLQAGPSQTYSIGAGLPQISAIQTVPQSSWMQTLLVNSVQAGPSQVYQAPAGQLPVSLIPAGMPQASPGQAESSHVGVARDCTLQMSESRVKKRSWTQNENKDDATLYLEQLPIITASEYIKGRDPTDLTVLHAPADRAWWYLAGHYVMVTEAPISEQTGIYYVLSPLSRLIIPEDLEDVAPTPPKQKKVEAEPSKTWLKVKSFARMCDDTPESTQVTSSESTTQSNPEIRPPPRVFLENKMYQKLSNSPLTYAKVLTVIRSPEQCRALLMYRDPLHMYCTRTGALTPLHREPNSDNSAIILTGKPELTNVLSELFSILSSKNTTIKHTLNYCPPRTNSPPNNLRLTNLPPTNLRPTNTAPTNPPPTNPTHTNRPPPGLRPINASPTNPSPPPPPDSKKAAKEKAEKERVEIGRQIVKRALEGPWPTADARKSRPESPWDSKLRKTASSETDIPDIKSLYGKVTRRSSKQPRVLNNQTGTPRQQKMILQPTDKQTYRLIMEGENDARLERRSKSVESETPAMSMGPTIAVGPAMNAALGLTDPPGPPGPVATAVPTPPEINVARQKKSAVTITPISKNPISSIHRKATGPEVTIKPIGSNAPAKNLSAVSKELPVTKKPEKTPVTSGGGLEVTVLRTENSVSSLTIGSMGPVVTRVSESEEIINIYISDEE